jgi:Fe-S-cluster formation regulator IscX/YfhJ
MPNNKPVFSGEYVMNVTYQHMIRAVDISLRKTIARLDEFEDDNEGGADVLRTLSHLNKLRATLVKHMESQPSLFNKQV